MGECTWSDGKTITRREEEVLRALAHAPNGRDRLTEFPTAAKRHLERQDVIRLEGNEWRLTDVGRRALWYLDEMSGGGE